MSNKISPRAFAINTVPWNQHRVTFVSMESEAYSRNPQICPADRMERVSEVVDAADLTVVEYFIPELEQNVYRLPVLGGLIRKTIGPGGHYTAIAQMGHQKGKRMGVADIANRPRYAHYSLAGSVPLAFIEHGTGTHLVRPHALERYAATPTDARRMLTAEAIMQEADRHPDGMHIAYVGAPAHVSRVARYITRQQTWLDDVRLDCYHSNLPGLDKALRIYEPDGEQWRLAERHDIVRRPMGALATLAAYTASW